MSFTVTMPQLGETVTEGTILRWVKQPGDTVAEDDVLLEISTDKVDTEVPSPFSGTMLEILVAEGETVDVGTALAVIGEPGEATAPAAPEAEQPSTPPDAAATSEPGPAPAAAAAPAPAAPPPAPVPAATPASPPPSAPPPSPPPATPQETAAPATPTAAPATSGASAGVLSPVVRRLAAEHGIDVSAVTGTGRGGRITRRDIEEFIETVGTSAPPSPALAADERKAGLGRGISELMADSTAPPSGVVTGATAPTGSAPAPAEATAEASPAPAQPVGAGSTEQPLGRLRTRIATNMIKAKQTAAHVWTSMEVDFEAVERVRRAHRPAFKEREGFSLTYLPFIARATMDALAEYPVVNSSFDLEGGTRTFHGAVNLGIGVDLNQEGLVVMTIRGADGLRMRGVAREVRRLADKARSGAMEPDDLAGSTFTLTNPGPYGSFMSAPIINVPNVAILSTDGIKKRPVVITDAAGNDAIAIHHVGYLGLTWDHRAFDGSTAVLFLRHIKENLETWDWEQELA